MTSLYEITDELASVMRALRELEEAGDIDQQTIDDTLAAYFDGFEAKAGNVIAYIKNANAEAEKHANEAKRLNSIAKTYSKEAERLKDYLFMCMQKADMDKLKDGVHTASIGKPRKVPQIDDIGQIPAEFIKIVESVNKTELLKSLKSGEVSGASLVDGKAPFTIK